MNTPSEKNDAAAVELFNALLDKNLDDVADLPEYFDYVPAGFYKLKIIDVQKKMVDVPDKETKQKVATPVIQIVYELQETLELAHPDKDVPVKAGGRFNESFFFGKDKEKPMEVLKAKFKEIATAWNIQNVLQLVDQLNGAEIGATIKSKQAKDDDTKYYIQVSNAKLA